MRGRTVIKLTIPSKCDLLGVSASLETHVAALEAESLRKQLAFLGHPRQSNTVRNIGSSLFVYHSYTGNVIRERHDVA